jgi:hypothetical protein
MVLNEKEMEALRRYRWNEQHRGVSLGEEEREVIRRERWNKQHSGVSFLDLELTYEIF